MFYVPDWTSFKQRYTYELKTSPVKSTLSLSIMRDEEADPPGR